MVSRKSLRRAPGVRALGWLVSRSMLAMAVMPTAVIAADPVATYNSIDNPDGGRPHMCRHST